jgi:peptide/nickel transport system substrate-binding protein
VKTLSLMMAYIALLIPAVAIGDWIETPSLMESVQSGKLPVVSERVPVNPLVVQFEEGFESGIHGGEMRFLMGKQKDIRQVIIYGYARLIGYTPELRLKADILESFDVFENRIFTLHLRRGHKWSDGHAFTSEDFRYYWEDVALNPELSKGGPTHQFVIDGELPIVEYPDQYTVRYSWKKPNPYFLSGLASARPLYIYKPAHYLRQFHPKYQTEGKIQEQIEQYGKRNWMGVHVGRDRPYKATNPDLPSLQPWVNSTYPPSERFIFKRNPFYHRVDEQGRQLPYVDQIAVSIASSKLIPAKTGANEVDLQGRYLRMDNYTFLRAAAKRYPLEVRLWNSAKGAHVALYPNFNTNDAVLRVLIHELNFRRALSHAIHRREINQVVYFGLARESNNTVLPESPLFRSNYQTKHIQFDLALANKLLDELGLTKRDDRGVRLMSDGRPLEIIVQTAGESTEQTDILELIQDSWLKAGIKLYSIPSTREVFRNRIFSGEAQMSIWSGLSNALSDAISSPEELAPNNRYQYQWPKWGQYAESRGKKGEAVTISEFARLERLNDQWRSALTLSERQAIWHKMLAIHRDQLPTIGLINGVLTPVVVSEHLNNVPDTGFFDIAPGAYFGIYRPDTFWFDEVRR